MPDESSRRGPSKLYPILDTSIFPEPEAAVRTLPVLARAGVRLVQLRAKDKGARDFCAWAAPIVACARDVAILTLINDRADVARATGADGVHVGQDDPTPSVMRRFLGKEAIIGISTHSVEQAREAEREPVDYVAIGPVFATRTKNNPDPVLGPAGVEAVRAVVERPLVAIGGITLEKAPSVRAAGADSLAVVAALWNDPRPLEEVLDEWMGLP